MKKYLFLVTLVSGTAFTQIGEGFNEDAALMDACASIDDSDFPNEEIASIDLQSVEFKA